MRIAKSLLTLAEQAKEAAKKLRLVSTDHKNRALLSIADALRKSQDAIFQANEADLQASNLSDVLRDRLSLQGDRLEAIISDLCQVVELDDPIGEIIEERFLENGLILQKKRVPIGVLAVIYEARPNVTVDIASLALKTGNCVILRGGKETLRTNRALLKAIHSGLKKVDLPEGAIQLIKSPLRSQVKQLVKLDQHIDMIIPRGGEGLHRFCREESTIPVITGGIGICHLFVDESADVERSIEVIFNAKTQRPAVCNALGTLLVHQKIAAKFLPQVVHRLQTKAVSFRLDPLSWEILQTTKGDFQKATDKDWDTEWLSLILGIKIVDSLAEAIAHIQTFSTQHSDGILTNSSENAQIFVDAIDSAAVYVNASTRFTDGAQFGLGAEAAVSTQKLHARGPMGLKELTTYKWIGQGNYHVRG